MCVHICVYNAPLFYIQPIGKYFTINSKMPLTVRCTSISKMLKCVQVFVKICARTAYF